MNQKTTTTPLSKDAPLTPVRSESKPSSNYPDYDEDAPNMYGRGSGFSGSEWED